MAPLRLSWGMLLLSSYCIFTIGLLHAHAISMKMGIIEFPRTIKTIFPYKIFYEGQQVKTEIEGNRLFFKVPINRPRLARFFILFVEDPHYILKESEGLDIQNTVDYLKSGNVYRIFELQPLGDTWRIKEYLLPSDSLMIPDNTIIVYMPPSYIDTFVGGNSREFPRIIIKENILDLIGGSLDELKHKAEELIIEAINMNALHVPVQEATKIAGNKRIVVPTV